MNAWGQPFFSDVLVAAYMGLLTCMWAALCLGVGRYGRRWRLAPVTASIVDGSPDVAAPLVSICVPARNEARNIQSCVIAALGSAWSRLEVIIVDDRSDDDTGALAAAAADGDDRFRLVSGTIPPAEWAGKPWACARAAGESRGEILIFVDADVRLAPETVGTLVKAMGDRGLDMASAFGTWDLQGFWERVVIPAVGWMIRGAVDLDRVNDPGRPEAFANGQMIAVRRAAYESMGGHAAVRAEVLDDVRLAEALKRRAFRIGLFHAPWMFQVRLYRSLSEIIAGYGKNLYEGMGRSPAIGFGAILFIVVGTLLPFALLAAGLISRELMGWAIPEWIWLAWLGGICGLEILFRWRLDREDGRKGKDAWAHPIANLVLVYILFRAVIGIRSTWKGRSFVDGRAAPPPGSS